MKQKRTSRFGRRALALLFGCVIAGLAAEGGLRVLLFSDRPFFERVAGRLRQPGYYADMRREGLYWKLQRIWMPREKRRPLPEISPGTGWTGRLIDPVSLTLADEEKIGERRPVLLYGDSFAECATPQDEAWQGLLERSPEGQTHALINFGTSGFGTDQSLTMLESTIGRYAARNPLVIFSIFLDEDPDRALLDFRGMPKPRYELERGELVFQPLQETNGEAWWDDHPPRVVSYLWRLLRGPHGPLPVSWRARLSPVADDAQVIALNRALLARMHRRLEELHIEHLVLGFHGRMMLDNPEEHMWRETFVRETCSALGVPFLSSRPYLIAAAGEDPKILGPCLYITEGPNEGHFNARGNCVVFEAMRQALHGEYGHEDVSGVDAAMRRMGLHPDSLQEAELSALGRPATLRFHGPSPRLGLREVVDDPGGRTRVLALFPELEQPLEIEWRIEKGARFSAEAGALASGKGSTAVEAVRLQLLVDGAPVRTLELSPGDAPVALEQELSAFSTFTLRVEPIAGHPSSCWLRLLKPAIE